VRTTAVATAVAPRHTPPSVAKIEVAFMSRRKNGRTEGKAGEVGEVERKKGQAGMDVRTTGQNDWTERGGPSYFIYFPSFSLDMCPIGRVSEFPSSL
jgi:hypothetical protein